MSATTIVEGMPCTVHIGSDRYAASISKVISPTRVEVSGRGPKEWTLRKDGEWRPKGAKSNSGYTLGIGYAENYRDPSF